MMRNILLISIVIITLLGRETYGTNSEEPSEGQRLYLYTEKELSHFLKIVGYSDSWKNNRSQISRNSDGTALRFLQANKGTALIVTCDGTVFDIDIPGYPVWFNDDSHIVAWHGTAAVIHYSSGESEKVSCAFGPNYGPDPAGKYFIKRPNASCPHPPTDVWENTGIYSIEHPYQSLANIRFFRGERIFFKNDKVLLFGRTYNTLRNDVLVAHTFQLDRGEFIEQGIIELHIPEQQETILYVQDVSPWSDEVLLVNFQGVFTRSVWYLFNLQTRTIKRVGKMPILGGGRGFFLQCDILKKAKEAVKEQEK